jgi:transposase
VDARQQRGVEIAARSKIQRRGNGWVVPSQSLNGSYLVTMESDGPHCTCPDFELRGTVCKHGYAVTIFLKRETVTETTPSGETRTTVTETAAVRLSYPQNWPAYNRAHVSEKEMFCNLLRDLCVSVPEPVQQRGRPRIPVADALFSACFKVYSTASSRRFMTDLRAAHAAGLVSRPWHFNTVLKVIEDDRLTPILHDLIAASAAPLRSVETTFAVDSTGFGTQCFYRHYSAKYGHDENWRDFVKLHALIGTKTNVIAAVTVTDRNHHDSPQFRPLIEAGAQAFSIETVVADKGYSGRENVELVASIGADPYIAFRSNAKETTKTAPDAPAWRKLFHLYNFRRDEFLAHYHVRSNAESTFSSMKRVFGDTLRSRGRAAQTNELLLKVIAHNIVCVIHSIFELDVPVTAFATCTQTTVTAPKVTH